jgi:benzodiazapine receptor
MRAQGERMEVTRPRPLVTKDLGALSLQIANVVAFAAVVAVNVIAELLPLANNTNVELAKRHPDPFSPTPYAFTIWNAIYGGLFAYVVFQALPSQRSNRQLHQLAPWFWTSCAANVVWTFLWHQQHLLASLIAVVVLVGALAGAYRVLQHHPEPPTRGERWCVYMPFSLYLGWTVVALLASFAMWAVEEHLHWVVRHPDAWAIATIVVATLVAAIMGWFRRESLFMQPVLWALIGIVVRYEVHPVSAVAAVGALVIVTLMARAVLQRHREVG